MKLLITGGSGFIGSNFILYWIKSHPQDTITNLDKLTYAASKENLSAVENNSHYEFIKGDICDRKLVRQLMKDANVVVNFAAETHVDRSITSPSIFIQTNIVGTHVLLEAALDSKISRFHHISTDEVFGSLELNDLNKFNERTPYNPRSPYSASKASSDHLVRSYYYTYGLPVTITNCSNNYGPYQFPEKLIPLAITNILEEKKVPVYGNGLHVRDWLFVVDHCRAIEKVLLKGKIGETYCVGGQIHNLSNLEVVKKIIRILGKDESWIEYVKDRAGHDRKYSIDYSKINRELDWEPQHDFDTWLDKTVDWYRANTAWWKKLKSGDFQKYYSLQYPDQ